ncbi:hypothetical protein TREMEDRAFT_40225 [Tremella mesenterica DSM 1558]|uniref:uncharacterized protein n=1 Tax=Tremella mesenterica (strain ATCC 24925 / CBS 8224 / DSM 1558 / NBRC 9311 / NRRL Y-6157 / RJB 2259-6 / UBC 559-6) TaxID=578456 RepID=UPI0003F48C3A|nr:uncharacterized protein TREMEDRAFT_40225 [Tremella mesenterica DSM 1558]EIW68124.1 hypothetical protein TREMEDRAFT_40225 [Tremella mesenterica DSM 1558]
MASSSEELSSSLEKHNSTFTKLLSFIPPQFYIALDPEEADSKWMKNKKRRTGEEIKEHKRQAKISKLDPSNPQTTDHILASKVPVSSNHASKSESTKVSTSSDVTGAETGLREKEVVVFPSTGDKDEGLVKDGKQKINPLPPAASIAELKQRLQNKLESFRKDRGVDDSDPVSRDALESARRAKREEQRDKKKKDRKKERESEKQSNSRPAKTQLIVPILPKDNLTYPSLALPSSSTKSLGPIKPISNPAQALAHLEKHNAHLASLPEEKRRAAEEKEKWAKALQRAGGEKVHDEAKVLKKAVKRVEKGKQKSGKEWAERKKSLDQAQAVAIKKRNDNIASRASAKRDKRLGVKSKGTKGGGGKGKGKSRGRPGFEGKKGKA